MEKNPPGGEAGRNRKETPPPGLLPVPHKAGQPCADRRDVGEQQDTQGTSIEKGSSVKVTVSLGEQTVKLPDFVGMTLNDATIQCSTLGITFSTLQENSDTVDENVIIRQSVKAGTEMTEDTQLYLIVSKGKKTSSSVAASSGSAGGGSGSSGGSGTNEQADSGTSSVNEDEFITEEEEWGD